MIMKKIFTLFVAMILVAFSYAQLADESTAPDFNLYEINKTTGQMITDQPINLYSMLNDYKVVYIDVSATTCSPCYNFHKSGTLETIYNNYGPNSSVNDSRVLFIEGASTGTNWAALTGNTSGHYDFIHVYGSTTEVVPYPVIPLRISPNYPDNYNSFHSGYAIGYFPTVYMVCPNRMLFNLNNSSSNVATNFHNQIASKCPSWTNTNDAMLQLVNLMDPVYFCGLNVAPRVSVQNLGTSPMTSATFRITHGGNVTTYDWTGNIAQFESQVVEMPALNVTQDGVQSVTVEIVNVNGVADEGSKYNSHDESFNVQLSSDMATASQNFTQSNLSPWTLADYTGGYCGRSSGKLRFRAFNIPVGGTAEFYSPLMNFTTNNTPGLTFDVAHQRYSNSSSESLAVKVSSDCGTTWTDVYLKEGADLATVDGFSGNTEFVANSASMFRTETVDLSAYAGNEHVVVKFVLTSGYGNNVWLDNIQISNVPLAVGEIDNEGLAIFPNPVNDVLNINYNKTINQIDIYDVYGKLVKTFTTVGNSINVSDLSEGVYMLNMQTEEGVIVRKIVKE